MFNKVQKNLKRQVLELNEADILSEQFGLVEDALAIIQNQLSDIDSLAQNEIVKNVVDELRHAELLVTKKRYLDFFYQIAKFLLKKVSIEERDDLKFYLPNVRTLLDIYAKLLYLANQNPDKQMLTCIYERLLYLKKLVVEEQFEKNYSGYKPYLDSCNHLIPDYSNFSKKKVKNYLFPTLEQIIKNAYLNNFRPPCLDKEMDIADKAYGIYRHFSEYTHGNMLNKDSFGNEDLWIIRNILFLSSLMFVLIDADILDNRNNDNIQRWYSNLLKKEERFHIFYDKQRMGKK